MDIENYNEILDASSNFKDYSNDDNKLLNDLKNYKNKNINKFKIADIDNSQTEEEEESEEDEDYLLENLVDDDYYERKNDDNDLANDKLLNVNLFKNIRINYDGEISEIESNLILNDDKIEYLLKEENKINFFKIG